MSNHFSADYLKAPGDDRRLDLTDVFCFKSSKDPDKIILIACSNSTAPAPAPIAARGPEFYPGAVYRINVDTDGDADQVLPLDKTAKRLPGLIGDVQLTVIEGGPHAIPWTHAGQVNAALLDFLRS